MRSAEFYVRRSWSRPLSLDPLHLCATRRGTSNRGRGQISLLRLVPWILAHSVFRPANCYCRWDDAAPMVSTQLEPLVRNNSETILVPY